jgi:hypothetical protein
MHFTKTQSRDPDLTYNKMTISELDALSSETAALPSKWSTVLRDAGGDGQSEKTATTAAEPPTAPQGSGIDWQAYFAAIAFPLPALGGAGRSTPLWPSIVLK